MKLFNQFPIKVSFYLKKNERGKAVVYCKISLRGTQTAFSTGIRIEDPERHWRVGAFEVRNFNDENFQLQSIRKEIESLDSNLFRNADEVKRIFLGEEQEKMKLTILHALHWGFKQKIRKVKRSHVGNIESAIKKFEKYLEIKNIQDWSVISDHPHKVTRVKVIEYYNWMCDNGSQSSANTNIGIVSALYKTYYKAHQDSISDLVMNVFSEMQEHGDKQDCIEEAIGRRIEWKYIEKIEKARHEILDCIFDKKINTVRKSQRASDQFIQKNHALGLLTMIIANTGLSFVEFGKADVFDISRTIKKDEFLLSSRRVKTGKRYRIPIDANVAKMIKELNPIMPWKPYVNAKRDYDLKDKARAYRMYRYYLDLLAEAIEYKEKLTPHRFRHTFAMRQLNDKGLNLETVAEMLGDTIKTTSENYASYTDKTIQENYNKQTTKHSEMLLRQS